MGMHNKISIVAKISEILKIEKKILLNLILGD